MTELEEKFARILDEVDALTERLYALADEADWEGMLGLARRRHEGLERLAETRAAGEFPAIAKRLRALQCRDAEFTRLCARRRDELARRIGELGHSEQALLSYGLSADAGS